MVPFFVVELIYYIQSGHEVHRLAAIFVFALASILDGVDGFVARHYNQTSELGVILDPLADKLLLVSGIIVLSLDLGKNLGQIPLWLAGTVIGRDALILIGMTVIWVIVGKVTFKPRFIGKAATVLQMIVVMWVLLEWDQTMNVKWFNILALSAALFTGVSGLFYIQDGLKQLGAHPASLPMAKK